MRLSLCTVAFVSTALAASNMVPPAAAEDSLGPWTRHTIDDTSQGAAQTRPQTEANGFGSRAVR